MLGDKPKVITLADLGTRYDHYAELREIFADGVEVVKQAIIYQPMNEMNKRRLESLQHAVNEIDRRIEVLSGYEEHSARWSKFGRELDSIKPIQTALLTEGFDVVPQVESKEVKPIPPCPNRTGEDYEAPNGYSC
jgi:hypothetical protein